MSHRPSKVHLANGDVILFSGGIAVVRFFGKVKFGRGEWVGLELSGPMGDCDGSKNSVRYYKCNKNHGKFIRLSDVKRKITAEELLLKLNSEVEKNPKGKLSLKEKKDLERQISDLARALNKQQVANSDLEKELEKTRQRNRTLMEQVELDGRAVGAAKRASSEPINAGATSRPLEKGLHLCFRYAHDLLKDIRTVVESNVIRQEELSERIDDKLHLMLMELIRTHSNLEEMGLVTRVEAGGAANTNPNSFEPVITNKNRPPISTLFSSLGQNDNPVPSELRS